MALWRLLCERFEAEANGRTNPYTCPCMLAVAAVNSKHLQKGSMGKHAKSPKIEVFN
jgi:hypothetical protein